MSPDLTQLILALVTCGDAKVYTIKDSTVVYIGKEDFKNALVTLLMERCGVQRANIEGMTVLIIDKGE